jgi:hypothetical protein
MFSNLKRINYMAKRRVNDNEILYIQKIIVEVDVLSLGILLEQITEEIKKQGRLLRNHDSSTNI